MAYFDFKRPNKQIRKKENCNGFGLIRKHANVPYGTFSVYGNNPAIYGIKNVITNKIYVGSTKNVQQRLMKHFNELFHNRHCTKKLQEDFNKYGFKSFSIIIFNNNTKINLLEEEKKQQISIGINNLYNEKITGYYIDEEYRKKLKNSSKATHKTKEYREKMSKMKTNMVAQYHFDGTLIKIWDSALDICNTLRYTRSVILSCCNRNKPHAYGYYWRYVDSDGNIVTDGYAKARRKNKN